MTEPCALCGVPVAKGNMGAAVYPMRRAGKRREPPRVWCLTCWDSADAPLADYLVARSILAVPARPGDE
jgi:hypothetical protein